MEDPAKTHVMEIALSDFHPRVAVAAIYLRVKGEMLVLRKAEPKREAGRWGVPAGKLESAELPIEAAQRELFEETSIHLEPTCLQYLGPLYIRKPDLDYVYHMFEAELATQPAHQLSPEHDAAQWLNPESAFQLPLMQGAAEALKIYQKRRIQDQNNAQSLGSARHSSGPC